MKREKEQFFKNLWIGIKDFFKVKRIPYEKECPWPEPRNYGSIKFGKDFSFGLLIRGSFTKEEHRIYFDVDGLTTGTLFVNGKEVKCNSKVFLDVVEQDVVKLNIMMKKPSLGKHIIRLHTTNRFHNHVKYIAQFNVVENIQEEPENSDVNMVVYVDVEKNVK